MYNFPTSRLPERVQFTTGCIRTICSSLLTCLHYPIPARLNHNRCRTVQHTGLDDGHAAPRRACIIEHCMYKDHTHSTNTAPKHPYRRFKMTQGRAGDHIMWKSALYSIHTARKDWPRDMPYLDLPEQDPFVCGPRNDAMATELPAHAVEHPLHTTSRKTQLLVVLAPDPPKA